MNALEHIEMLGIDVFIFDGSRSAGYVLSAAGVAKSRWMLSSVRRVILAAAITQTTLY